MLQMRLLKTRDIQIVYKVTQQARGQEQSFPSTHVVKPPLYRKSPAMASGNRLVVQDTIDQ